LAARPSSPRGVGLLGLAAAGLDRGNLAGENAALLDFDVTVDRRTFDAAGLAQRQADAGFDVLEHLALNVGLVDLHIALDRAGRTDQQIASHKVAFNRAMDHDPLGRRDGTLEGHALAKKRAACICAVGLPGNKIRHNATSPLCIQLPPT
jgi:hypothetical protein